MVDKNKLVVKSNLLNLQERMCRIYLGISISMDLRLLV